MIELQKWYFRQCDEDWEHSFGIKIETLDNPGWHISIDLEGTDLDGKAFVSTEKNYDSELEWLTCKVRNNVFEGACGPMELDKVINIFLEWAHGN